MGTLAPAPADTIKNAGHDTSRVANNLPQFFGATYAPRLEQLNNYQLIEATLDGKTLTKEELDALLKQFQNNDYQIEDLNVQ
jgi:hypothetical protein